MRRLSIIDLKTGHQPISNEDETIWIVFNGEIYNYRGLRQELIERGHRFRTESDTETIIHLYEQAGVEAFRRIEGMFAIALWDSRKQELILARDRFGKKPLYIADLPEGFWFGSELKSIRCAVPSLTIDPEALRLYFVFNYIPDPRTAFGEVKKLGPGEWLRYRAGRSERGRFWRLPAPTATPPPNMDYEQAKTRLRDLFDESVRSRLIADVPLGAFLSGGIDSSSVVASMAMHSSEPVKTFSIGFEEESANELPYAAMVSKRYHTDHHAILVQPDSVNLVSKLTLQFDEPFGDSSAIPTYLVSEFAARHVKVALTGDGGDELFCGYESFFAIDALRRFDRVPQIARGALSVLASLMPYSGYGKNYLRMMSRPSAVERYFELNYAPFFLRKRLFQPEWMVSCDREFLKKTFGDCLLDSGDVLSDAVYFEATAKLTGDMLVKVDRMSMAASLEVRCPMLDRALSEFAMSLPHGWKLRNGRGKKILLDALGDRLPPELLNLPKKGFGIPLAKWFRTSLRELVWDHLTSKDFLGRGILRENFVRYLIEEHMRARRNNEHWLWMLLTLELWFRGLSTPAHERACETPVPA